MIEQQGGAVPGGTAGIPDSAILSGAPIALTARSSARRRLRPYQRTYLWVSRVVIVAFIALMLIPIVLVLDASFSSGSAFSSFSLIPQNPTLQHYQKMFDSNQVDFLIWMRNSAIVCLATAVLSVALVTSTGYAFSRFRFKGRKYGLMSMLLVQMFPAQMSFIAFYYMLDRIGLLDTFPGLIFVYVGGGVGFNAWLFKGFIDALPRDLEESAYVDGATPWQAFYKIILPLTRPMMAVIFIFVLVGNFNEFILASWLLRTPAHYTMAVGLRQFINGQYNQNWTDFAAAAVLASLPLLVIFMLAQRWLVSGLAAGAVKG